MNVLITFLLNRLDISDNIYIYLKIHSCRGQITCKYSIKPTSYRHHSLPPRYKCALL